MILSNSMVILIDFDGTCVQHEYPEIGGDIGAVPVLKKLVAAGNQLILWTMRDGAELLQAIMWFETNGIPLYAANHNPTQREWTTSPKAHGNLCIDDINLGIPLIYPGNARPYVDWDKIETLLTNKGMIPVVHRCTPNPDWIGADLKVS